MSKIAELVAPGSLRKATVRIVIGASILISVMGLFSAAVLWNSFQQVRASVLQQLQTASTYNEQSLTRTIESIDSALERVRLAVETSHDPDDINTALAEVLQFSPHLRQILVIDEKGAVVADSAHKFYAADTQARIDLEALGVNESGMRSLGSRLHIGMGIPGRFIGPASHVGAPELQWLLPIALLNEGVGQKRFHIVAGINPLALSPNLDTAVYRDNGEVVVAHLDGDVIFSNTTLKSGLSALERSTIPSLTSDHFLQADSGLLRGDVPQKPVSGVVAYRLSSIYPIAILVAATDQDIFQGWSSDNAVLVLIALSIPFITAAIVAVFGVQAIQKLRLYEGVRVLSQVAQQSPASIMITNREGKFQYVNAAFGELFGYTLTDIQGRTPRMLKSGKVLESTYKEIWGTITKGGVWRGEMVNKTKGGELKWIDAIIFGLSLNEARPEFYVGIETDISLKKEYEDELVQEKMRAEAANIAKMQFLSSMSHELRTPLNAILGFGQLLQARGYESLTPPQKQGVDTIVSNGEHLLALVEEVLDLAQIDTGNVKLALQDISLNEVFMTSQAVVSPQAQESGVQITMETPDDLTVWADAKRVKQILLNLMSNAIKYNHQGGTVKVSAHPIDSDWLRIVVTDTGNGIEPEKQNQLFEPFNRLGKESSTIQGTGIGLNITKDLAQAMGGTIGFESVPGQGSSFWVDLPTCKSPSSPAAPFS